MQHLGRRVLCSGPMLPSAAARQIVGQRRLNIVRVLDDGSIRYVSILLAWSVGPVFHEAAMG